MGKRTNTAVWSDKYSRWQINVQYDGRRRSFYSGTLGRAGQRECNAKADSWLDDGIDSGKLRIEQLCDDYIADLKLRTGQSHWRPETSRIETWIKPRMGHLRPEKITEQTCQDIINAAYSHGLSKKTIMNLRSTIVSLLKYCRKRKVCSLRPDDLTVPQGAVTGERTILQPQGLVTLFTSDQTTHRGKPIRDEHINYYRFIVVTGYRPGETLGLMAKDIEGSRLRVNRSINIYGEVTQGKNKNAKRTQELSSLAKAIWEQQLEIMNGLYVFGSVPEKTILKRWKRYCKSNNIPETTLYELRHTFVSAVQSLPEAYIKSLVGHSKSMDTSTYIHDMDDTQRKIANAVDAIFTAILTPETEESQSAK